MSRPVFSWRGGPPNAERIAAAVERAGGLALISLKPSVVARSHETGRLSSVSRDDVLEGHDVIEQLGGEILQTYRNLPFVRARLDGPEIESLLRHPLINAIEPDIEGHPMAQDTSWGYDSIAAPEAWSSGYKGNGAHIVLLDSGIDSTHYYGGDINPLRIEHCSYADASFNDCWDDSGHGSFMYGVMAGKDNSIGTIGVGNHADVSSVKVCVEGVSCRVGDMIAGIDWATNLGEPRTILNISVGFPTSADTIWDGEEVQNALQSFVEDAYSGGLLVVAAAGNAGTLLYPAGFDDAIAVTGIDETNGYVIDHDCDSEYSGSYQVTMPTGSAIEISGPVESYSLWLDGEYDWGCGSSVAAAFVSGVSAVAWGYHTGWSNSQIRTRLSESAVYIGSSTVFGAGRVDAVRAVEGPPVSVNITGPDVVPEEQSCTWAAVADGGTGPYTYSWSGVFSGSGTPITRTVNSSGTLYVTVTDDFGAQDTDQMSISVDEEMWECMN